MEFDAKFTDRDLDDLAMLVRRRYYWPRLLLGNLHGAAIWGALIWIGVLGILGRSDLPWWGSTRTC